MRRGIEIMVMVALMAGTMGGEVFADEPIGVFVSIPPQVRIVESIGGERVNVETLVEDGQDPHTFEPSPRQMMRLAKARLYFSIGLPFEARLLEKLGDGFQRLLIADCAAGIERQPITACDDHHDHGGHAGHPHQTEHPDPHVWLSPPLLETIAANIADNLSELDPEHKDLYQANLDAFRQRVRLLDQRLQRRLAPYKGQGFFVFHPAFGYFARQYGLKQVAVETDGKAPRPKQLSDLIKRAKAEGVRVIFVQPQFDRQSAEAVAKAIGGAVEPLDSLAPDILANLERMADTIERAMKREESR